MFTLKVNTSKPQQPSAFIIEHQTEKPAVLRKKVVITFPSVLGLELGERKITLDTSEPPEMFYKRKNKSRVNSAWSEHFENFHPAGSSLSSTTNKTRVQIQLQQPNESFSTLIHSEMEILKKQLKRDSGNVLAFKSGNAGARGILSSCQRRDVSSRSTARRLGTTKTTRWNQRCKVADKNVQRDPATVQKIFKPKNV